MDEGEGEGDDEPFSVQAAKTQMKHFSPLKISAKYEKMKPGMQKLRKEKERYSIRIVAKRKLTGVR